MLRVRIVRARSKERAVLMRLMQLYLHDLSEIDRRAVNENGEFEYQLLPHYWREPQRVPLLARVGREWAGFALVRLGRTNEVAEFFVMRKFRRMGVGRALARECFALFPGRWRVRQMRGNDAARAFWRAVIPFPFEETSSAAGTIQRSEVAPERQRGTSSSRARAR